MKATAISTMLLLVVSATTALVLTPLVRTLARNLGWMDRPDGRRKRHIAPVPRIGGVAVYTSFAAAAVLLVAIEWSTGQRSAVTGPHVHLLVACAIVMIVGLADDLRGLRPAPKVIAQTVAALYLFFNGYQISAISNPFNGESVSLGSLSLPVTLIWFVGMSNAFNLIDGLDGLAAGIGLFSTTTLFVASAINNRWDVALMATALGGALLGVLRYNFNPASIFLGDSGSLFVGFALAAIAVRGSMKSSAAIAVAAPLLALAVPLLDAGIAVLRRFIGGKRVFEADGDHIHHRMVRKGFTPQGAVMILYAVAALFGALSLLTMTARGQLVGLVVIATSVVTWIGIQQLGYSEFGEVQRVLKQGLLNERQAIGNNVYLLALRARLAEARDLPQLWAALVEAATRLQFLAVEVRLNGDGRWRVVTSRLDDFPAWRSSTPSANGAPRVTWTVPLAGAGAEIGTLVLERSLAGSQPQFESSYLLDALSAGFGPRLGELLTQPRESADDTAGDPAPCLPAAPRPVRE